MNTSRKLGFSGIMFYLVNIIFMVNVFGILLSVIMNFRKTANRGTWLPESFSSLNGGIIFWVSRYLNTCFG